MTYPLCSHLGCENVAKTILLSVAPDGTSSEVAVCNEHFQDLHMDYVLRNPRQVDEVSLGVSHEGCRLHAVLFLHESERYAIVLKGKDTGAILLFKTGYVQACSVYGAVKRTRHTSPLTYELFVHTIQTLGGSVLASILDGYDRQSQNYTSHLLIQTRDGPVKVKCRCSDAVGIAHFAGVPIRVDSVLLGRPEDS